jgi:hypothetical protein
MGKEKKSKSKKVMASPKAYSILYKDFFQNKKLSDFTIKVGDQSFPAHKAILDTNSEFFSKLDGNSYEFPKEEDTTTAIKLINFYYTGTFEYSEESQVLLFTLLANKYQTKNFSGIQFY